MRHEKPDDIDWLAFCYIADELPLDEAAAFENRLADDQTAREAVARAVDLTRAVAVLGAEDRHRATPVSVVRSAWGRRIFSGRLGWTAITAATCLAVVLVYRLDRGIERVANLGQPAQSGEQIETSDGSPEQLALLWNRTREELATLQFDDWASDLLEETDEPDGSPLPLAKDEAGEDAYAANLPPSWMLAAVQAVGGRPGTEDGSISGPEEN